MAKHAVFHYTHHTEPGTPPEITGYVTIPTRNPNYRRRHNSYGSPDVVDRAFSKVRHMHGPYREVGVEYIGYWETSRTDKRFIPPHYMMRRVEKFPL